MANMLIRDLLQIFKSSLSSVLPEKLIRNAVKYNHSTETLCIVNDKYDLHHKNIYLVGTGKAVQNMAREVEIILGPKIKHGIISIPTGSLSTNALNSPLVFYEGAKHNLPDENAKKTATKVANLTSQLNESDILLVLISGGGSALLPLPKEPITLIEKTHLIKRLANLGADIIELNTVRKKISKLKGGQLAIIAQPACVVSLILSDIVGDPLDQIASGPTVENKDDPNAAIEIIKKYNLYTEISNHLKNILEQSDHQQVKYDKNKIKNYIIGCNTICINAAANESKALNYLPLILSNTVTGDASSIAQSYVKLTKLFCSYMEEIINKDELQYQLLSSPIPGMDIKCLDGIQSETLKDNNVCLILGGEITVQVKGTGKGGRNQQLALEYSKYIHEFKHEFKNFEVYFLSAGTDGIDGPTEAAGAIGYLDLITDCTNKNIDIEKYINNNDSYNFYKSFKEGNLHVITGHTNTNVMDIHIILLRKKL